MLRQKGFTLIELLIVIAIICILAAIAIPMYRAKTVKAKLTEVTNSMSNVASAVGSYYQDETRWPGAMAGAVQIKNSLGVAVPISIKYIGGASIGDTDGVITFTVAAGSTGETLVDGKTIVMSPSLTAQGAINWTYDAASTIGTAYLPKK